MGLAVDPGLDRVVRCAGGPVSGSLGAALALVLVVEGLLPFLAPALWRATFLRLVAMTDGQLRFVGLASITLGSLLLWLAAPGNA